MNNHCECKKPDWRWESMDRMYRICTCCGKAERPCDHIVGFYIDYLVLESDHFGTEKLLSGKGFKFKLCPECGEKLNLIKDDN